MLSELLLGILSLGGLVAFQRAMHRRGERKLAAAWERAQAEITCGNYESGAAQLAECIRIMPLWLPPRFLLGSLLVRLGRLDEAEEQLKMAQALQPREAEGMLELGIFYLTATDRHAEGVALLRDAIARDGDALQRIQRDPRLGAFRESADFSLLVRP